MSWSFSSQAAEEFLRSGPECPSQRCSRRVLQDSFDGHILVGRSVKHRINFMELKDEDLHRIEIPFVFTLLQSGLVHGLAFWFDLAFLGSRSTVWLSTAPSEPLTRWSQVRCLLQTPLFAKLGQTLSGTALLASNSSKESYDIQITATVDHFSSWGSNLRGEAELELWIIDDVNLSNLLGSHKPDHLIYRCLCGCRCDRPGSELSARIWSLSMLESGSSRMRRGGRGRRARWRRARVTSQLTEACTTAAGQMIHLSSAVHEHLREDPAADGFVRKQRMASTRSTLRIEGDDNLQSMLVGAMMRKIKSRTWKKQRYFRLQDDCMTIWYKSKKAGNAHSTFSVSEVEAVREGHQSEVLLSIADEFPANRCFTLVFRGRKGNLDLVAESAEEAQTWVKGIRKLIENVENMGEREKLDQWISDWFKKADKDRDGRMNFKEVRDLLKMMNIDMNEDHALRLFTLADKSCTGSLEDDEFVLFYKMLTQREDVLAVFQEFSSDGQTLSQRDLEDFLREEQLEGDNVQQHAMHLIEQYEPSETAKMLNIMTFDGFLMYLGSTEGSIFNPQQRGIYQNMDPPAVPLFHLFLPQHIPDGGPAPRTEQRGGIHQSHTKTLKALNRGCRCVEVDCWDGANGEPIVYHGHTFTSKILFKDVVTAVGNYAFKVSEYPVILSIENHCSVEQQRVMAQHLCHILGEKLLKKPLDGHASNSLPSPEDLKGKILVKAKKIGGLEENIGTLVEDSLSGEVTDEDDMAEMEEENIAPGQCPGKDEGASDTHSCTPSSTEVASFTESKARKYLKESGAEFVQHNSRQLTRVYPTGFRTDSSNFNPQEMWNAGCQIVALNFQTAGEGMDLNDGLFSQNGCCGYVLKPSFMQQTKSGFDPESPQKQEDYQPVILNIQVISGQQLPKVNIKEGSIVDPLVRVEIHGVPLDQAKQETRYIENNGFNPVWHDYLRFTIHTPELALVRFVVEDYDKTSKNDFVGQYTVPLTCMQQGYRHIHLLSRDGTSIPPSSLFVHVRITEL
ncbi:1-phosphatidylinositol 4,5-bisphosphate phosphodiesterase delta-4 [Oryzias melastigma]|uniref:Phosphoinositide phospholipase C n=1 Tax=Oryzias melastigma TaxID=30732 RepID=A0A834CH64_ORYME|nr:1-phosphatidylinositol 4,5-bisphosphate phosphodiesterase delta-4 [Oryzias melastigma]